MDGHRHSRRSAAEDYDSYLQRGRGQRAAHHNGRRDRTRSPDWRSEYASSHRGRDHDRSFDRDRDRDRDQDWDRSRNHDHRRGDRRRGPWPQSEDDYYTDPTVDPYSELPEEPATTGELDKSTDGKAVQFLLVRGLKANVDETLFAKGLDKLYKAAGPENDGQGGLKDATADAGTATADAAAGAVTASATVPSAIPGASTSTGASPGSIKRVFIIRDRLTDHSMGFGFIEFHSISDATAAMTKARQLGKRCTIGSKEIELSFPHMGVFTNTRIHQTHPRYTFQLREGMAYEYHDSRFFASELVINVEAPAPLHRPNSPPKEALAKAGQKRLNADTLDSGTEAKNKRTKVVVSGPIQQLQHWTQKQTELRGTISGDDDEDDSTTLTFSAADQDSDVGSRQSFIYTGELKGRMRTCCLLCKNDLGANIPPERHCRESRLHLSNLQDSDKFKAGMARLSKYGIPEDQTMQLAFRPQRAAYRDRAKERRRVEAKTGNSERFKMSLKPSAATATSEPAQSPDTASAETTYSKGFDLLKKSGYKPGAGLGAGTGITAPITQNIYAAGVGLGHEASNKGDALQVAERLTRGDHDSFVQRTREIARERYERMN